MNELSQNLSEALARIEKEQSRRLSEQDKNIAELTEEVQGCRDLQKDLERVLSELERLCVKSLG